MFRVARTLDLEPKTEFDQEQFILEKYWIQRKMEDGLLEVTVKTEGIFSVLLSAAMWTLLFGTFLSLILIYLFRTIGALITGYAFVFVILAYKFREPYAVFEIDTKTDNIYYNGIIEFGGIIRKVRYLGDHRIIEEIQIGTIGKKTYIRLVTNSGYLRIPYKLPLQVTERLKELGYDIPEELPPVSYTTGKWKIHFTQKFDRTEYFEELKRKKEARAEEKRKKRISKLEEEYQKQQESLKLRKFKNT